MKKIFIPFIFSAFLLAGCSQDRLDIPQKGVVSKDDFYKTDEDAQMALVAAYDAAATNYVAPLYNDNIIYALWNYVGDDMIAAGNNKTDNIAQNELNAFRFPTNNQLINVGYTSFFRAVYAANLVIDNFKDGTTPVQKKVVAEAKVLRALSYLQLAIGWGTPPIVDHVLSASDKPSNAESQEAVLNFIVSDCDAALPLIDERVSPQDKNGAYKVTKGLANTIKGKALLWKKDYAGAQAALEQVINSGKYELLPTERIEDNFHVSGDGSPEKIFELNLVYDSSVSGYQGHSTANMPWLWNWRSDVMTIPNGAGTKMHNNGWGECNPSQKFVDALLENDGIDSPRRKAWIKNYDEVLYEMPYATDGDNPVMGYSDFKASDTKRGIYRESGLYGHVGWFMWKVNIQKQDLAPNNARMQNVRIFRYAEVLLMYAECAAMTGKDKDKALRLLNDIQERAGSAHISSELTLDEVKNEKFLEMWLEGCRFQDLVRWGDTDELLQNGHSYPNFRDKLFSGESSVHEGVIDYSDADWCEKLYPELGFKKGKHELFPFPFNEMSVNENMTQNPGW